MRVLPVLLVLAACTRAPEPVPPHAVPIPIPLAAAVTPRIVDGDFALRGAIVQGGLAVGQAPADATALTLDGTPLKRAPDGRFVIGFGRDAGGTALLEATLADGTRVQERLRVMPRAWKIERIPQLRQNSTPNPEYERLRADEVARVAAARAASGDGLGWTERFAWPATGRISGIYGSQRILGGEPRNPHAGLDIAAPSGTAFTAPASGVVVLASPPRFSLEGNLLMLDHGHGVVSSFLHLSRIDVRLGQRVAQGQRLGAIGMTGRATGPHLHWALSWGAVRVDPQLLLPPLEIGD